VTEPVWKEWPESCPECGWSLEVFSEDHRDGWAIDGDPVRCVNEECKAKGHISADAEDDCYSVFPDLDP
jgi:N6-adenosine-specific RNA methylase IME4